MIAVYMFALACVILSSFGLVSALIEKCPKQDFFPWAVCVIVLLANQAAAALYIASKLLT